MNADRKRKQITQSLRELARAYSQTMSCLEETLATISRELDLGEISPWGIENGMHLDTPQIASYPVADHKLLAIRWRDNLCFLGNTIPFKLFLRIARRPNQYVTYEDLLQDVWEGQRSESAIRSAVKVLRRKLVESNMEDLAKAIDGSVFRHYGLMLDCKR